VALLYVTIAVVSDVIIDIELSLITIQLMDRDDGHAFGYKEVMTLKNALYDRLITKD